MTSDTIGECVHLRRSDYDVRIDRRTPWGNPFSHLFGVAAKYKVETREEAINEFARWAESSDDFAAVWIREHVGELYGKRLGCWCAPKPCHGDILLRMALNEHLLSRGPNE